LTSLHLLALSAIFFLTSIVSVVTGSTSLITVPAMLQFGIAPRSAVATNMLALTCMSVGGSLAFRGKHVMDRRRLPWLIVLTLAGSVVGAVLLLVMPARAMPFLIAVLMVAVAVFSVVKRDADLPPVERQASRGAELVGYAATFVLGVYGGFFSGGYVTLLTAAFVALFGMTLVQAVSTTKLVNAFSSAEILSGFGFLVELTQRTRDGGRDIIAISSEPIGMKLLVECKRYGRRKTVGIAPVQRLHGVCRADGATKGILVTTAPRFTQPAKRFLKEQEWLLEGRAFAGLVDWLTLYQQFQMAKHVPASSPNKPLQATGDSGPFGVVRVSFPVARA
jgi:hypothetical protein